MRDINTNRSNVKNFFLAPILMYNTKTFKLDAGGAEESPDGVMTTHPKRYLPKVASARETVSRAFSTKRYHRHEGSQGMQSCRQPALHFFIPKCARIGQNKKPPLGGFLFVVLLPAVSAVVASSVIASWWALCERSSNVHGERASIEIFFVEHLNCFLCVLRSCHLDETEAL